MPTVGFENLSVGGTCIFPAHILIPVYHDFEKSSRFSYEHREDYRTSQESKKSVVYIRDAYVNHPAHRIIVDLQIRKG